ncbi:hypothetical protein AAVH_30946, partial [Aphelenchoides avenae]
TMARIRRSYSPSANRMVIFTNQFVPMGIPAKFHCAAIDSLKICGENITDVKWVLRHSTGSTQINNTTKP